MNNMLYLYIFRKKNTYIFITILLFIVLFATFIIKYNNSLNNNKIEYNQFFLLKENELNKINKKDLLLYKKCLLVDNNYIIDSDEKLNYDDMILSYRLDSSNIFIKKNNLNIIGFGQTNYISNERLNDLYKEYGYYKVYLNKLTNYKNYEYLINESVFYSKSLDVEEAIKTINIFNIVLKIIYFLLIIMMIIIILNIIFDGVKNLHLLNLLGYRKYQIIIILLGHIILELFFPILILLLNIWR